MQAEHLTRGAFDIRFQGQINAEIISPQNIPDMGPVHRGGDPFGPKLQALRRHHLEGSQVDLGPGLIGGKALANCHRHQFRAKHRHRHLDRTGRPTGLNDRQRDVISAAIGKGVADHGAFGRCAIAEIPLEHRATRQRGKVGGRHAGIKHPGRGLIGIGGDMKPGGQGRIGAVAGLGCPGPQFVQHPALDGARIMHPVDRLQGGADENITVKARRLRILILDKGVVLDHPAQLPVPAAQPAGRIIGYSHPGRGAVDPDGGNLDPGIHPVPCPAIIMQDRIVTDRQTGRFAQSNAMRMRVDDDIFFDQHIAVIHRFSGQPAVHQFIAHENRLGPVTVANIQQIAADDDVCAGLVRSGGPELDHVAVVG